MERAFYLCFTCCDPPTVARLFLSHCAECWLYVQEVGSPVPLVPIVDCKDRNACGSGGGGRGSMYVAIRK